MDYSKINTLKLDNNNKIIDVLSQHMETANKISSFQTSLEKLNSNQKKLIEFYSHLGKDSMTTENVKNDRRTELVSKTVPVITIMQIFAYDKKKKNLLKRLQHLTPEYLRNCSDIELINISKKVWTIANKYGGYSLAFIRKIKSSLNSDKSKAIVQLEKEYGLIPDMIKNIEEANIKFIESLLLHEDEMKDKEKIVRKIKKIDSQTENLLQNKIDRFVFLLESVDPSLYKDYQQARKNQFYSNVTEAETINGTPPSKNAPVKQSQIKEAKPGIKSRTPQSRQSRPARKVGA